MGNYYSRTSEEPPRSLVAQPPRESNIHLLSAASAGNRSESSPSKARSTVSSSFDFQSDNDISRYVLEDASFGPSLKSCMDRLEKGLKKLTRG